MNFFDTHAHLNAEQFDGSLVDVIARAREESVSRINVVGTTLSDSLRAVQIAEDFDWVYATVGIQPNYVSDAGSGDFDSIIELADRPDVIAVGETGMDRYWDRAPIELQREFFCKHVELSLRVGKPFVVHMRNCGDDIVDVFNSFIDRKPLNGVMHSFTGDECLAEKCIEFGLHISFAGMLTYKKSDDLRRVAATIPMDRLLIETDCPYLSPHPHRSHRPNEPALIRHTAACLAEQFGVSIEKMADVTTSNALRLFGLD